MEGMAENIKHNKIKKVMVFGYGNMGEKHVRFLNRDDCEWKWHDPHTSSECPTFDFDYAIISTPILTHYQVYKYLRNRFDGPILVEKPAVIYREQFDIFDDPKVFVGVIERYNPVVKRLKELLKNEEIISLEFTRVFENCRGEPYFELAIHDLDLMVYLLDLKPETEFEQLALRSRKRVYIGEIKQKEIYSQFIKKPPTCIFAWGESTEKCREIKAVCGNKCITANLSEKKIVTVGIGNVEREYFEEHPLKLEHDAFLKGECPNNVKFSHDLMLRLLGC